MPTPNIVRVVKKLVDLEQALTGKCPFHVRGENEPQHTFIVHPQRGLYHCYICGAAGNALRFLALRHH